VRFCSRVVGSIEVKVLAKTIGCPGSAGWFLYIYRKTKDLGSGPC
jgi:hypothetical protein